MQSGVQKNSSFFLCLLSIGLVIGLCLLWPFLTKTKAFPYVGTWKGSTTGIPGEPNMLVLTFRKDGSCSISRPNQRFKVPYGCAYSMAGTRAVIKSVLKYKNGQQSTLHYVIAPVDNGENLDARLVKIDYPASSKNTQTRWNLQKVFNP
jgi:hypothetical protein